MQLQKKSALPRNADFEISQKSNFYAAVLASMAAFAFSQSALNCSGS